MALGKAPQGTGFTLVELLVTIFIIAIIVSVTAVNLDGDTLQDSLDDEARRLRYLLQLAREEALIRDLQLGLNLDASGYSFMQLDADGRRWMPMQQPPFVAYQLPDTVHVRLHRQTWESGAPTPGSDAPDLLILSSGEISRFALIFSDASSGHSRRLSSDGLTPVTLSDHAAR